MKRKLIIGSAIVLLFSCNPENQSNESLVAETVDTVASAHKISDEVLGDIIKSIPSPIEISMLIKESGGDYDESLLNPSSNSSNYNTNYKKALNLGIYGADMGYINIYNKSSDAISYLTSVKELADELNIGQFYDFETIKRLSANSENADSLLYITTSNFEKINNFLHEKRRSDQSVLILVGGWLEGLHISCQIAAKDDNAKLNEKIGEQKIVIDQMLLLVSNFKKDPGMVMLSKELTELKAIYDQVTITYIYREPEMVEVDGVLTIQDKSESKVNITKDQIQAISSIIVKIRTKMINA
jgi:hypothetical protein